jgi:hypothetical protein
MDKEKKDKHKDCKYCKALPALFNERKQAVCPGLGHCSHHDTTVILNDEACEDFKKKKQSDK